MFLEIYNEKVHDLLAGDEAPTDCNSLPRRRGNTRKDLRVREHPDKGPYVQNLRRVVVHDAEALLQLVSEGALRRHTAATRRNPTSSRSHALLELSTPTVTLHLADLAGSEKASWEGCGGGRQKEGANINKSLVALSNVISALVSTSCGKRRFVPYRDSALTWLLKDCFTGGARTYIIATVSPSVSCYGESASTLRWAAQARQLPEPRTLPYQITSSRTALQAQLKCLLAELTKHYITFTPETGKITYKDQHWTLNPFYVQSKEKDPIVVMSSIPESNNDVSTASSVVSGISDNTDTKKKSLDKNVPTDVDDILGPALERTRSGYELKSTSPITVKPRHYRSHEVFPLEYQQKSHSNLSLRETTVSNKDRVDANTKIVQNIPIISEQRADIVASVTERLYSKLKKTEASVSTKMESTIDKKIMEPLSELKICSNARQRLIEMGKKAMRNKRRIGIPAFTQTRITVKRVKDQAIDVQDDLETVFMREKFNIPLQDASTETENFTPRCKEAGVGSKNGSILCQDNSTLTDVKEVTYKNSITMTNELEKFDSFTQTDIVPPPRRKRRALMKKRYVQNEIRNSIERITPPVININISQSCATDSDSCLSEDDHPKKYNKTISQTTPDLISNHSTADVSTKDDDSEETYEKPNKNIFTKSVSVEEHYALDFPDSGDHSLPRVSIQSNAKTNKKDIEDLILGHNYNMYPYNIVLSPPPEREPQIVRFKDCEDLSTTILNDDGMDTQYCNGKPGNRNSIHKGQNAISSTINSSDSGESSKYESNSFIWQKKNTPVYTQNRSDSMVVKEFTNTTIKYQTAKAKIYKEFLGLEKNNNKCCPRCDTHKDNLRDETDSESEFHFRKTRNFFEEKLNKIRDRKYEELGNNVLISCDRLEASINKYDALLNRVKINTLERNREKPTAYLQHLVQLRKNFMEEVN